MVGGFLGAGKTTLLLAAAEELRRRGMRPAVILNDQGEDLVDTTVARLQGLEAQDVTGGCFCCRFSDLLRAMNRVAVHSPDVILAEPVGSCTDISATILQPLQEYSASWRLAPYTVLVDPSRADLLFGENADENQRFLFSKQIEEADLICATKADLYPSAPERFGSHVRRISAKTGVGVAEWLDEVTSASLHAGSKLLEIDYERYAEAEAALVWLNLRAHVQLEEAKCPADFLFPLFDRLHGQLTAKGIDIVHMKAVDQTAAGFVKIAACGNAQSPEISGCASSECSSDHQLLVNIRAVGPAHSVREIVETNMHQLTGDPTGFTIACFHPSPPKPERRASQLWRPRIGST